MRAQRQQRRLATEVTSPHPQTRRRWAGRRFQARPHPLPLVSCHESSQGSRSYSVRSGCRCQKAGVSVKYFSRQVTPSILNSCDHLAKQRIIFSPSQSPKGN